MAIAMDWLMLALLFASVCLADAWYRYHAPRSRRGAVGAPVQRLLHPEGTRRTPEDCPACRQQAAVSTMNTPVRSPVRPWREVKSRRGAPKRIATDGFACPTPAGAAEHVRCGSGWPLIQSASSSPYGTLGRAPKLPLIQSFTICASGSLLPVHQYSPVMACASTFMRSRRILGSGCTMEGGAHARGRSQRI